MARLANAKGKPLMSMDDIKKFVGDEDFTVKFKKRDGTLRDMKASINYTKYLPEYKPSGTAKIDDMSHLKMLTLETSPAQWRSVKLESIISIAKGE